MVSSDELYTIVGHFALTYGSLETTLKDSIIILIKHYFPNDDVKYHKTINMILMQNKDFSANLNILKFLVLHLISEANRSEWELLIKDLEHLMLRRNLYIHNMYGFDEDEGFIKYKTTSSFKKYPEFISIEVTKLKEDSNLLDERYRQLFDSVIEQFVNLKAGLEEVIWISKFPRLKY